MTITAIGITTNSCPVCSELKRRLIRDFSVKKIDLDFVEIFYDIDPKGAIEEASKFGIEEIPSFVIAEEIFTPSYDWNQVLNVFKRIR